MENYLQCNIKLKSRVTKRHIYDDPTYVIYTENVYVTGCGMGLSCCPEVLQMTYSQGQRWYMFPFSKGRCQTTYLEHANR